jgi:hypothetical protein
MSIVSVFDEQCLLVARYLKSEVTALRKNKMNPTEVGVCLEISRCTRFNIDKATFHDDLPQVLDELKRQGVISYYEDTTEMRSYAKYGEDGTVTDVVTESAEEFQVGIPLDFDRAYQRYASNGKDKMTVYVSKGVRFYIEKADASGGYIATGEKQRPLIQALKSNKRLPLNDLAKLLGQTPPNAKHTIDGFNISFKNALGLAADLINADGGYGFNLGDYRLKFTDT